MKDSKSSDVQPLLNDQEKKVKTSSSIKRYFHICWVCVAVALYSHWDKNKSKIMQSYTQNSQQNNLVQFDQTFPKKMNKCCSKDLLRKLAWEKAKMEENRRIINEK